MKLFPAVARYDCVNDINGIDQFFEFIDKEDRTELLCVDLERDLIAFGLLKFFQECLSRAEVFLPFITNFVSLPNVFPQVP